MLTIKNNLKTDLSHQAPCDRSKAAKTYRLNKVPCFVHKYTNANTIYVIVFFTRAYDNLFNV